MSIEIILGVYFCVGILTLLFLILIDLMYGPGEMLLCLVFPLAWFRFAFIIIAWPIVWFHTIRTDVKELKKRNYVFTYSIFKTLKDIWIIEKEELHRQYLVTRGYY